MSDDFEHTPEWRDFQKHVLTTLVPMLRDSAITVSLCPSDNDPDVKFAVELGMSIMLDKPIIVVAWEGQTIPARLTRVADEVLFVDMDSETDRWRLQERIAVLMAKIEEKS